MLHLLPSWFFCFELNFYEHSYQVDFLKIAKGKYVSNRWGTFVNTTSNYLKKKNCWVLFSHILHWVMITLLLLTSWFFCVCVAAVSIISGMGSMYLSDWSGGWENRFYIIGVFCFLCYKTGPLTSQTTSSPTKYLYDTTPVVPTPRPIRRVQRAHTGKNWYCC